MTQPDRDALLTLAGGELFSWHHNPYWAQEGGDHFDGNWIPDCGGKLDYDPIILRFSCRVWPDGNYTCSTIFGDDFTLSETGIWKAPSIAEARAKVEGWCREQAKSFAAILRAKAGEST